MEKDKLKVLFIFEILGRPPEHLSKTMEMLIDKLGELEGIEISKKNIHEPKPIEKEGVKDMFTTFSEVEVIGDNLDAILNVVFHGMPSHIEVIEPEEIRFKNFDLSQMLSLLTSKLHRYDEIAKSSIIENKMLAEKVKELQEKIKKQNSEGENKEDVKEEI